MHHQQVVDGQETLGGSLDDQIERLTQNGAGVGLRDLASWLEVLLEQLPEDIEAPTRL